MNDNTEEMRYSVVACIDLQGFSSHLETGNYDLRTRIGGEAIERLKILDNQLTLLKKEKELAPEYYPKLFTRRVNDSLIISIDLPDILLPSVGASVRTGFTGEEFVKYFDVSSYENEEDFVEDYQRQIRNSIQDLILFVGLIARIHSSVSMEELKNSFPGVKTVMATGYRLSYKIDGKEDFLSANFAFSNSYIASNSLHGAKFFVDNNILHLLSVDKYCVNLLKRCQFIGSAEVFDIFSDRSEPLRPNSVFREGVLEQVELFRKDFWFRELDATKVAFLQIVPQLMPYLEGKKAYDNPKLFKKIFETMSTNSTREDFAAGIKRGFFVWFGMDEDIRVVYDLISVGKSEILEKKQKEEMMKNLYVYFDEKSANSIK